MCMAKKIFFLLALVSFKFAFAQDDIDAMRYSQTSVYGDARFTAMGGSFGALGANLSCMNFNPAGIAMYRNGEFIFTPGIKLQTTNTDHYGTTSTDFASKFNISNVGFVSAWDSKNNYPPSSKQYTNFNQRNAFGISYNRLADFNTNTSIDGFAAGSTIVSDFVNLSQGHGPASLNPTYEWLGYQTGVMFNDPYYDSTRYSGDINYDTAHSVIHQTKKVNQSGRMGELAFSFAHAFDDKFYLGATMGIPMIRYTRTATYTEVDAKSTLNAFRSLQYNEQLLTTGSGINLKIGGIYRVSPSLRVGAYIHTPTILNLTDNYQYDMTSTFDHYEQIPALNYDTALSGQQTSSGSFRYKIITPARAAASVCYIYKKLAAVNADVEFVNYASARIRASDYSFDQINLLISSKYKSAVNVRLGAEFNVRPVVIRVGYASYGSPFGQSFTGNQVRNTISGGVGFRGPRNAYVDFGLMYTYWKEDYYLFDGHYVNPTQITNSVVYFTATLGVKFN
jgi:hypothetical protein